MHAHVIAHIPVKGHDGNTDQETAEIDAHKQIRHLLVLIYHGVGKVVADMFNEFGVTQNVIDFDLGDNTTNVDGKIAELKRYIAKNIKQGGSINGVEVLVDPVFFDKLINNAQVRPAYQYYLNSGAQRLRDDLS